MRMKNTANLPKKIVFIASLAESLINFRLHLIKEFLARHYQVVTIAPEDEKVAYALSRLGVKFIPLPLERNGNNPFRDLFFLKKLFILLRRERPDLVFTYTIKPVIYGTLAAKLSRVPSIYAMLTGTGYVFAKNNLKSQIIGLIARSMFRFSLRFNKKLFFQNPDNVIEFRNHKLIRKQQPLAVINGSGVDIDHFSYTPPPEKLSFLMIARLLIDKGIREYIAAAKAIKQKHPDIIFKLVGWIDTNPNSITEQELNEAITSGVVQYLGKLSDVREVIQQTAVYVLPSYGEGTPRTVLEAMAIGRPIITTDVPGCRETVTQGENGLLVSVKNVESLTKAMEYFIDHPKSIQEMGEKSREKAVKKYDVNKVNRSMLEEMNIFDSLPGVVC